MPRATITETILVPLHEFIAMLCVCERDGRLQTDLKLVLRAPHTTFSPPFVFCSKKPQGWGQGCIRKTQKCTPPHARAVTGIWEGIRRRCGVVASGYASVVSY